MEHLGSINSKHFPLHSVVKNLPAMQDTGVWFLSWEDPLKKEMATHSSILAWEIPWTGEPCGLQSMGSQRAIHDRAWTWKKNKTKNLPSSPAWATMGPLHYPPCFHSCPLWVHSPQSQSDLFKNWYLCICLFVWLCRVSVVVWGFSILIGACRFFSCGMWDLVPWPGIKPRPPALEAGSLSHWTATEVPRVTF